MVFLGLVLWGFGFVAVVVAVVGVVVVAAVVLFFEEEPQAAMTRAMATMASDAMTVARRFLISLKRTPPGAITSRSPLDRDTTYSRLCALRGADRA